MIWYVCIYICIHIHICMYICLNICTWYIRICTYTYLYIYIYIRIYIYILIHTHIHTYVHTYVHTYIPICTSLYMYIIIIEGKWKLTVFNCSHFQTPGLQELDIEGSKARIPAAAPRGSSETRCPPVFPSTPLRRKWIVISRKDSRCFGVKLIWIWFDVKQISIYIYIF